MPNCGGIANEAVENALRVFLRELVRTEQERDLYRTTLEMIIGGGMIHA